MAEAKTMRDGVYTALVTPFRRRRGRQGGLDQLLERQLDAGVAGVVPAGCTGEAAGPRAG